MNHVDNSAKICLFPIACWNCELREGINVTFDLQGVNHRAYNRDRGPVAIFGLRVHLAF